MRGLLASVLLFASMIGIAHAQQGMDLTPPPEMSAVNFLVGNFKGNVNFYYGDQKSSGHCTAKSEKVLNGRYMHTMISYDMPMPGGSPMKMEGMHVLTFDPAAKQFVSYWFDGSVSYAMHSTGNIDANGKLVLVSDPTPMSPGGPTGVMRSTWWKTDNGVAFSLETQQGDKWMPLMDGVFTK